MPEQTCMAGLAGLTDGFWSQKRTSGVQGIGKLVPRHCPGSRRRYVKN